MKKLFSSWLPLFTAALLLGTSLSAQADIWRKVSGSGGVDGRIGYNDFEDGQLYVFQNAVSPDTSFYLTSGPTSTGSAYSTLATAPLSDQGKLNQVFQVEFVDNRKASSSVSGCSENIFLLKSYATGQYVSTKQMQAAGAPVLFDYLTLTDDKAQALEFCFAQAGVNGTYSSNTLARSGYAVQRWGAGTYNMWDNDTRNTTVAIAYNPDRGQLTDRWTSIEADLNNYCSRGYDHGMVIQLNPWGGTRSWFAYNVEIVSGKEILQAVLDQYTANGDTPANYQGGTAPGYYEATAAATFAQAWTAVEEAVAASTAPTDDQIETLQNNLAAALAAVQPTLVNVSPGYYVIQSANSELGGTQALTGGTQLNGAGGLALADYSATNAQQLFSITAGSFGFNVQNVGTAYYVNLPGTLTNTLEPATVQTFTKLPAAGQFAMGNTANNRQYYQATATGLSYTGTAAAGSAAAFTLLPVDSATAAQLIAASTPLRDQLAMQRLIATARARVAATDSVVELAYDNPYITEASQLSTNAPEPTQPDQTVAMAIDGDVNTYFHTRWSPYKEGEVPPTEAHYLLADAGDEGFGSQVAFHAVRRRATNGYFENSWPVEALISASNDSVTWDSITVVNLGNVGVSEYTSPIINLDDSYRYLKFSLIRHSQAGPNGNGQYAFCFAEFNWYDAEISASRSASMREDTKQQLAALRAAIATAQAVTAPTTTDVQQLQAALDAFNAVYPETGELEAEIQAAQEQHDAAPINNGVSGFYNTADADVFQAAITAAAAGDLGALTKAQIDQRMSDLKTAEQKFSWSYNVGDSNKVYRLHFITNNAARTPSGYLYTVAEQWNTTSQGYHLSADAADDAREEADDAYYFTVKQVTDTTWALQHVKSGYYVSNPLTYDLAHGYTIYTTPNKQEAEYVFRALGDGTFDILPKGYNKYWFNKERNGSHYYVSTNMIATNSNYYYRLEPVSDVKVTMRRKVNDLQVLTLPYRTTAKPVAEDGSLLTAYKVVGFVKDAETNEVTDLKAVILDANEPTPAGTPIILETGNYGQYDAAATDSVTFDCMLDTTQMDLTVIGNDEVDAIVGLQSNTRVEGGNGRLFLRDAQLSPISGAVTLARQTGYINLNSIVDTSKEYNPNDVVTIPINGSIVGIKKIDANDPNAKVNVYTADGVLVKKNVAAGNATRGLPAGLYIVGQHKVIVK